MTYQEYIGLVTELAQSPPEGLATYYKGQWYTTQVFPLYFKGSDAEKSCKLYQLGLEEFNRTGSIFWEGFMNGAAVLMFMTGAWREHKAEKPKRVRVSQIS